MPRQVVEIEQLNGPIAWLTSRRPIENIYKPMFSENFPARIDRTVADGRPNSRKVSGISSWDRVPFLFKADI